MLLKLVPAKLSICTYIMFLIVKVTLLINLYLYKFKKSDTKTKTLTTLGYKTRNLNGHSQSLLL